MFRALPFALATRIRRTSVIALWPLLGAMMIGFLGAGPGPSVLLRGLGPTLAVLVGYMLRDAYRVPDPQRRWRQGSIDAAIVALFVAVSQAVLAWAAPEWVMTRAGATGCVAILAVLTVLRAMNPARTGRAIPHCTGAVSLGDLRNEVAWYHKAMQRAGRIEIAACAVLLPALAAGGLMLPHPVQRFASTVTFVCVAYVGWYIWHQLVRVSSPPVEADFGTTLGAYRVRLEHSHVVWRTYWRWYLLPLSVGPAILMVDAGATRHDPWHMLPPAVVLLVVWATLARYGMRNAGRVRKRIGELDSLTEAPNV